MKVVGRYAVLCIPFEYGQLYEIRQQLLACSRRKTAVAPCLIMLAKGD